MQIGTGNLQIANEVANRNRKPANRTKRLQIGAGNLQIEQSNANRLLNAAANYSLYNRKTELPLKSV
ncbi:hypothetical protein ABE29_03270 [Cytobacillus firmus]|nr:hypothetical protein [Cytobacillus firmus]MBG9551279.1 hypothetical protein [Cytobacillus firmus]MBG9558974.1 hypothetical protein [Cytobacillus firmus]MBG9576880.1 hypothetical protein [Cytobacillus firmus]